MLEKLEKKRLEMECVGIEDLVPKFHLLRKIDRAIEWEKIYGYVENLYSANKGRPSIDPVVLVKMVMLQHIYGIPSIRKTAAECEVNVAYRWFLGYNLQDKTPHFSTVSYNFLHRFNGKVFEQIFTLVLEEAIGSGYIKPEVIFVDATHIKANANRKKQMKKHVPAAVKKYEEQLHQEINADREAHGKKPLEFDDHDDNDTVPPTKEISVSKTDPESGLFHKGEHKVEFAYSAHTVCDKNNFVLEMEVTPGNIHDSLVFDTVYEKVTKRFPKVEVVTADAGYKTPWICKKIFDDGRVPSLPYKAPMTMKDGHKWYEYVYDEYYDQIICPEYKTLSYATTNREGYREYKSKPYICETCSTRQLCTKSKSKQKTVNKHIWYDYIERAEDIRHSPLGKETYPLRSQTIERVFADAKEKHGMRYTNLRGLSQVFNWVRLKFAAMNLKKLAMWRFKDPFFPRVSLFFNSLYCKRTLSLA